MKKFISGLLTVVLLVTMTLSLCGCGKSSYVGYWEHGNPFLADEYIDCLRKFTVVHLLADGTYEKVVWDTHYNIELGSDKANEVASLISYPFTLEEVTALCDVQSDLSKLIRACGYNEYDVSSGTWELTDDGITFIDSETHAYDYDTLEYYDKID